MILTGEEIMQRMGGDINIKPFHHSQVNPNSYNLRLGNTFLGYRNGRKNTIFEDPEPDFRKIVENDKPFKILPGQLILAETMEYTETNNLVPMLEGRSSLARQFCQVHVSAGFGDVGFKGKWTLEIVPYLPVTIWPGMEICQIYYHTIEGDYTPYSGRYNCNKSVQTVINGGI